MRRKGKPDKFPPPTNFIIEQSSTMKKLGYSLASIGILSAILIIPDMKIENIEKAILIFIFLFILLSWPFIILPYNAITTKKKIIVKSGRFIIK